MRSSVTLTVKTQITRKFNEQDVVNTAWAFATVNRRDEKLFAALARAAERQLIEFNEQGVPNTARAFATVNY